MNRLYNWIRELVSRVGLHLALILAGYVLLAILAVFLTDKLMGTLADKYAQISNSRDTLSTLEQLRSSLLQAESAQRGYLLTLKDSYLVPYIEASKNTRKLLDTLNSELALQSGKNRQSYAAGFNQISNDIEGKITEMQIPLTLAHDGELKAAKQVLDSDLGLAKMTQISIDMATLQESKEADLAKFMVSRDRMLLIGRVAVALSVLLVLVIMSMVIKKLFAEIVMRDRKSKKLEHEMVSFEQQLEEHTRLLKVMAVDYQYDVERERRKLARELHDELGSILTATKMDISWVLRKIKDMAPEASEKLNKTMRYLDQGIQFQRRVVQDLHPAMLSTFGLIPALKELIESAAERNKWELELVLPDEATMISEALGLIVYRLIQETLNNASKYAQASNVSVYLFIDEEYLKLEVEDNGVGMDMTQRISSTHGLEGMRHRVIAIGGKLKIESELGKGMQTLAMIPLNAAPDLHPEDRLIAQPRLAAKEFDENGVARTEVERKRDASAWPSE